MNCPNCGSQMTVTIDKVKAHHVNASSLKDKTLQTKTKKMYVQNCPKCGKRYIVTTALVEIERANA